MENPIKAVIVTASDSRTRDTDVSGNTLEDLLSEIGVKVVDRIILSDDFDRIAFSLKSICDRGDIDIIATTGGTGLAPRDNMPEATKSVIEREVPGIAEQIRSESLKFTKFASLSRGVCGIRNRTLIVNFPGSPKSIEQTFGVVAAVLFHAIDLIRGAKTH